MDLYDPTGSAPRAQMLLRRARKHNDVLDAIDRKSGHATPMDCPPDMQLRTVMDALTCGIETRSWSAVAEGLALLQNMELHIRHLIAQKQKGTTLT